LKQHLEIEKGHYKTFVLSTLEFMETDISKFKQLAVLRSRWFWIMTAYVANNLDVQHQEIARHAWSEGFVFFYSNFEVLRDIRDFVYPFGRTQSQCMNGLTTGML
jgi:hypothetical protein